MTDREYMFSKKMLDRARAMFREVESFTDETLEAFDKSTTNGFLTRQYFTRGKHDLVLPAWLLGLLGPDGEGNHGISGSVGLKNTDLRNYYAVGSLNSEEEPVVDHRGGIIPLPESYTVIFGTIIDGRSFYASEAGEVEIRLGEQGEPVCTVYWKVDGDTMVYDVYADRDENGNEGLGINVVRGFKNHPLLFTVCPMDQDGVTKIEKIEYDSSEQVVTISDQPKISITEEPIRVTALPIAEGHAGRLVTEATLDSESVTCPAGLASFGAQFPVRATPLFTVALHGDPDPYFTDSEDILFDFEDFIYELPQIDTSNEDANYYFKASAVVLRLLADIRKGVITVGPSVQEKLWLPAMLYQTLALDRLGLTNITRPILDNIHTRVDSNGLAVKNQQWDAQGALVLALINHFYKTDDVSWIGDKYSAIKRVAEWVVRQRKKSEEEDENVPEEVVGLVPPGNASFFDPLNWKLDYFYSHNFWSMGILDHVVDLATTLGRHADAEKYGPELEKFKQSVDDSITDVTVNKDYLPAGPYQRDNAQMIFNLNAFYPLKLYLPAFQALNNTVDWLWKNYTFEGGVLIDQKWNSYGSYFSILLAQSMRYVGRNEPLLEIMEFMLKNTTNKSGWAEGISPLTRKGSVGDSPNGYAAAEWVNLMLDLFAENYKSQPPVLLKGMPLKWLKNGVSAEGLQLFFEATLDISAKLDDNDEFTVEWDYDNPNRDMYPVLWLPKPAKTIPENVEQLSTRELRLTEKSGSITLTLEEEKLDTE